MSAVWNVESLRGAVDAITAEDTSAVSWADADGRAMSRRANSGHKPPQLVAAAIVRDADVEARIRALPGFVRLTVRDETDINDEPCRMVRAVFAREA